MVSSMGSANAASLFAGLVRSPSALSSFVVSLVAIGVSLGVHYEGWHPITALYAIVQITTTVGYGDVTPTSAPMQLFVAAYSLALLLVVAHAATKFAESAVSSQVDALRRRLRSAEVRLLGESEEDVRRRYSAFNQLVGSVLLMLAFVFFGTTFYRCYERCSCSYGHAILKGCDDSSFEACERTGGHMQTWVSSFYMSVITLSTVGFGDYTPHTKLGQLIASVWMLLGVGAVGFFMQTASKMLFDDDDDDNDPHVEETFKEEIDWKTFQQIDTSQSGFLSRAEYVSYVLLRSKLVDPNILAQINREYDLLDTVGEEKLSFGMLRAKRSKPGGGVPRPEGGRPS